MEEQVIGEIEGMVASRSSVMERSGELIYLAEKRQSRSTRDRVEHSRFDK